MTTREVVLDGGSPWGFRLHGGADVNQPLRISRVNPGSKAALRGIREGDFITSINNQSTKDISNAEAHALLRNSGDTLKLGLNEDGSGSPKRRQYKTVHQETHSETVKKSSVTSYTVTSSKSVSQTEINDQKTTNGNTSVNGNPIVQPRNPIASQRSTLSSNCSSSSSTPSAYTSVTSPSGTDMADNARSRRKRARNNRKKTKPDIEEYCVESPKRTKSPEAKKKPIKSRSLDDDDIKIQEMSEVSENEDKSECKAIVSEAESDVEWETTTQMEQSGTISDLSLPLEQYTTEHASLISPEEELTLRNFLEGLNLVNSPEDAFKQIREVSTIESVTSRRAQKRAAIEQYFSPMMHNPRFLDVISEETSDLSEPQTLTQHLKQGTPEPELPNRKTRFNHPILLGTRIVDLPVTHEICSTSVPESSYRAEIVFLEDSSNSTTPDPKSDDDEKDFASSAHSSAADLHESEVVEETKQVKVTVKKNDVLVSTHDEKNWSMLKNDYVSELTPPPTPDDVSPKNEIVAQKKKDTSGTTEVENLSSEDGKNGIVQIDAQEARINTSDSTISELNLESTSLSNYVETEDRNRSVEEDAQTDMCVFNPKIKSERIINVEIEDENEKAQIRSGGLKIISGDPSNQQEDTKERIVHVEVEKESRVSEGDLDLLELPENTKEKIIYVEGETRSISAEDTAPIEPDFKDISRKPENSKERIINIKLEKGSSSHPNLIEEKTINVEVEEGRRSVEDKPRILDGSERKPECSKERIIEVKMKDEPKPAQNEAQIIVRESENASNQPGSSDIEVKKGSIFSDPQYVSSKSENTKERIIHVEVEKGSRLSDPQDVSSKSENGKKGITNKAAVDEAQSKAKKVNQPKERIVHVDVEKGSKSVEGTSEGAKERIIPVEVEKSSKSAEETSKIYFRSGNVSKLSPQGNSSKPRDFKVIPQDFVNKPKGTKERIIHVEVEKQSKSAEDKNKIDISRNIVSKPADAKERIIPVAVESSSRSAEDKSEDISRNTNDTKERIIYVEVEKGSRLSDPQDVSSKSENAKEGIANIKIENQRKERIVHVEDKSEDISRNTKDTKERIINVKIESRCKPVQNQAQAVVEDDHPKLVKKTIFAKPEERTIHVEIEERSKSAQDKSTESSKDTLRPKSSDLVKLDDLKPPVFLRWFSEDETAKSKNSDDNFVSVHYQVFKPKSKNPTKPEERKIEVVQEVDSSAKTMKPNEAPVPPVRQNTFGYNSFSEMRKSKKVAEPERSSSEVKLTIEAPPQEESSSKEVGTICGDLRRPESLVYSNVLSPPAGYNSFSEMRKSKNVAEPDRSTSEVKLTIEAPPQEESPSKEVETICGDLRRPESLVYSNVLSPPAPSPSPSLSSGSSSRATSLCTAKYNSMSSSMEDLLKTKLESPLTLRELCVNFLMCQPFGTDVLQELADVSSSIEHLTNLLVPPTPAFLQKSEDKSCDIAEMSSKEWVGLATDSDPHLLVCLSPTQKSQLDKSRKESDEAAKLLDLHSKFIYRTSYHDAVERRVKNVVEIKDDVSNRLLAIIRDAQEPKKFSTLPRNMESARLKAKDLSEWLQLARNKSRSELNLNENNQNAHRRKSLPDFYEQQMYYLREKEREIQKELEMLEEEKRRLSEMSPRFRPEDYHISKKGDFAENKKSRPLSMPISTEFFRQQMYEEYMDQMAAREERKLHKVIKVSQIEPSPTAVKATGIEDEFMDIVKQKQKLGKLKPEESEDESDEGKLPKHLQEFMDMTDGVWTPGQKQEARPEEPPKYGEIKNEPISPVWTPKSATSSPTAERKEFRPIKYESPVLGRKSYSRNEDFEYCENSKEPPWKVPDTSSDTGIILSSTLEKRLPTSHSSPACGFNDFPTTRLPRAQNPTITLLQKAREGQLPKGALYIEQEQIFKRPHNEKPPLVGPGEILYKIKNEYTSESDSEKPRKMADLGPRKFEGIGPTTKDGMPLILRSEVKDANQSKWYKKMYDTIHKQKPHRDEFVTVRYKQRRGQYPYTSGYLSEPEPGAYDSDFTDYKYATLDRRRLVKDKENDYVVSSTMPRAPEKSGVIQHGHDPYKNQPGRIENYIPGHSSISEKEAKEWWDEVMDIFDGHLEQQKRVPQTKSFINQALKESGYESDSTLVFRRRDDTAQQLSPSEQKEAYKIIQKGGDVPLHGLRKPAPERPKEPEPPVPPPKGQHGVRNLQPESPRKYVENEVTIHYKTPVRQEIKEYLSEDELAHRQAEAMKKIYQEERRRKYLQVSKSLQELQDMNSRRHTDNFIPSQKSPISLNRYDDFDDLSPPVKPRPRSPEPRLMARALYNFVGQTARELTFRKGDLIYVRRQVDKNWYEGELNAMVGLFPVNYVEIVTYDTAKSTPRKSHEGQARAKYNFLAQTHLELSLAKGELVVVTRRVDDNWFEGKIGGRKGIFPASYVELLIDPSDPPPPSSKPVAAPAAHSMLLNGSAGGKESMGSHSYTPSLSSNQLTSSYHAKPVQVTGSYGSLSRGAKNSVNQALHIETQSEPIPYRALYKYLPQNDDELELLEGDTVYVLEKCDDGWYVGSSDRTGAFGTFPGNYVEKI